MAILAMELHGQGCPCHFDVAWPSWPWNYTGRDARATSKRHTTLAARLESTVRGAILRRQMSVHTLEELRERAKGLGPRRVVVVSADDDVALTAAAEALRLGIALPVLAGGGL